MARLLKTLLILVAGILPGFFSVVVAGNPSPSEKGQTLAYKVTSRMWDTEQNQVVQTSLQILQRIHHAFHLWEEASGGVLHFEYAGLENPSFDNRSQVPYDGFVHIVLNGNYNFHGEQGNGGYNGKIPSSYKRGYVFLNKDPLAFSPMVIAHEIGHALGLPHSGTNASVMFAGPWAWGSAELPSLTEQDGADLRALWAPGGRGIYSISGNVETTHAHSLAFVFAVNSRNGHSYSVRSDHMGRFTVTILRPGEYRLMAKAVEVAWDLPAVLGMTQIPQSHGWYVSNGRSTPDSKQGAVLRVSEDCRDIPNLSLRMIDEPAPFPLNQAAVVNAEISKLRFMRPGDEITVELPQVRNLAAVESFGSAPDYEFLPVVPVGNGRSQVTIRIAKNAEEGERLVIARDQAGRTNVGLVGIHILQDLQKGAIHEKSQ